MSTAHDHGDARSEAEQTARNRRARRRDRRVYLASHPVIFGFLAASRARPVVRVGPVVVVNDSDYYRQVLTRVPLDRVARHTTGGSIARYAADRGVASDGDASSGALFDMTGDEHRAARQEAAAHLGARAVDGIRPSWMPVLERAAADLAAGRQLDLCRVADAVSGHTTAALFDVDADDELAHAIARSARRVAGAAISSELPSMRTPRRRRRDERSLGAGLDELCERIGRDDAFAIAIALAAVNTTYASVPRMVAWASDAQLWSDARDPDLLPLLMGELQRVIAASPILPRVTEADAVVGGIHIPAGTRVVLVARHAAHAHDRDPDASHPQSGAMRSFVFGAGAHSCPGVHLARAQAQDVLAMLAPFEPRVTAAVVDRRAGLPSWGTLRVRATAAPA